MTTNDFAWVIQVTFKDELDAIFRFRSYNGVVFEK